MGKGKSDLILVSGCLSGDNPSYNGASKKHPYIERLVKEGKAIPVCPELLGGLKVPRPRSEIKGGDGKDVIAGKACVIMESGDDMTEHFLRGAKKVLGIAKKYAVSKAILKARSPACGCGIIYDGRFSGKTVKGDGVTTALLKQHGIEVIAEEE